MRSWIIASLGALAIGFAMPTTANSAPATGQSTIDRAGQASRIEDVRYVVRCHHVRVWRNTPYGRQPVRVRRCHRVYY